MKKIIIVLLVLIFTGCHNKSANIEMVCNDTITKMEVRENDILCCKLLSFEYKFKVVKIDDKKIILKTTESGLTDRNNIHDEKKEFILNYDSSLTLTTQTTDVQRSVKFIWK